MSWMKWIALLSSTGVIFNYGAQFQAIASQVQNISESVERHDKLLQQGDRWTKQDHQYYENAVDRRLSVLENKVDKIYLILLKQQ
jgi:hypothetical protein